MVGGNLPFEQVLLMQCYRAVGHLGHTSVEFTYVCTRRYHTLLLLAGLKASRSTMDQGWHPSASCCKPPTSGPHYEVTSWAPQVSSLAIAWIYSMTLSDYHIDLLNNSFPLLHWFTQWLLLVITLIYLMTLSDYCSDLLKDSSWLSHWFTQRLLLTLALIYSTTSSDYCIDYSMTPLEPRLA
jgi:hypothetical protein